MATQITAKFEFKYKPTPDSNTVQGTVTYQFEAGMFSNLHWTKIVAARGTTVDCEQLPKALKMLFIDILFDSDDLEEIKDGHPEVTFLLDCGEEEEEEERMRTASKQFSNCFEDRLEAVLKLREQEERERLEIVNQLRATPCKFNSY